MILLLAWGVGMGATASGASTPVVTGMLPLTGAGS